MATSATRSGAGRRRHSRRPLLGLLAAALVSLFVASPATAAPSEPDSGFSRRSNKNFLMVADPAASRIFFFHVPDMTMTGELGGVTLGGADSPAHGGIIPLPDGRLLMNDETAQKTLAVRLDREGKPAIVNSVTSTPGTEAPWNAVDPNFRYYAVASNIGVMNLIDLKTFKNTQIHAAVIDPTEDVMPILTGKPLTLFLINGTQKQGFAVTDIVHGTGNTATSTTFVPPGVHHGAFVSPETDTLGVTNGTEPTRDGLGLEVFSCAKHCATVADRTEVPWDVPGSTGGRCFRPRLGFDGGHVLCPIVRADQGTAWPDTLQDFHVTNLETKTATRINVGQGTSSRGEPTSIRYTAFVLIHPQGDPRGDELKLIDVRPDSPTFVQVVGTAHLPQMTHGPIAGQTLAGFEKRFAAITPDGHYAFATQGGDGKISMVDTATMAVTQVSAPTPLHLGGHITAFQVGFASPELMGR